MTCDWTEEKTASLRRLWAEGLSAREIAKQIGDGVTRNSIIGKANRMGLSARAPNRKKGKAGKKPSPPPLVEVRKQCRWPIGDPAEPGFKFCCKPSLPSRPYCEEHCRRAYRRLSPAKQISA